MIAGLVFTPECDSMLVCALERVGRNYLGKDIKIFGEMGLGDSGRGI